MVWPTLVFDTCWSLFVSLCVVLADNPGPWDWSRSCLSEMQGQVWRLWASLLAVCTCLLPSYVFHACGFYCENCIIVFGPSLIRFYPSSSWQTRQHVVPYLSDKYDKEKCHAERALAISCIWPVFLKREPQVPRCPCQSFITTAAVHAISKRPHGASGILWMKIRQCGYRSLDFIFVFVSMQ